MNYTKQLMLPLAFFSLSTLSFGTVYFDGEDETVGNWHVHDNKPAGATLSNVIDEVKNSNVIEFKGEGRLNSYMMGDKDFANTTETQLSWSMNFSEKFKITIYLKTTKGLRTLFYVHNKKDRGFYEKKYIKFGLGLKSMSGTWQDYSRNIEADLKQYEPDNKLLKIRGLKVQGSGRIDNLRLDKREEIEDLDLDKKEDVDNLHLDKKEDIDNFRLDEKEDIDNFRLDKKEDVDKPRLDKKEDVDCLTRKALDRKIKKKEDVTNVNTSCIKDMSNLFSLNKKFNQNISKWDVSSVTNMSGMFEEAESFNQPIGKWDVSNVIDMKGMFVFSKTFNQDIGKWDVSSVTDMNGMFNEASKFNQDITKWDVSSVRRMNGMFANSLSFNQNIEKWDVSKVTDMSSMFILSKSFKNHDLSEWNVKNVKNHDGFIIDAGKNNTEPKWVK